MLSKRWSGDPLFASARFYAVDFATAKRVPDHLT